MGTFLTGATGDAMVLVDSDTRTVVGTFVLLHLFFHLFVISLFFYVFVSNSNLAVNWKKKQFTFRFLLSLHCFYCFVCVVLSRRFTPVNFVHSI
jgi:hypothetical protein